MITVDIKERIFALYLGCEVWCYKDELYNSENDLQPYILRPEYIRENCDTDSLLLKPFSSITDEDAIEVAKVVMRRHDKSYTEVKYEVIEKGGSDKYKFVDIKVKAKEELSPIAIRIDEKSVSVMKMAYGENQQYFKDTDLFAPETFTVYQILISKGYALPYMGYSVEDLVKEGIYKLK